MLWLCGEAEEIAVALGLVTLGQSEKHFVGALVSGAIGERLLIREVHVQLVAEFILCAFFLLARIVAGETAL